MSVTPARAGWAAGPGVLELPDGVRIRGRGLRVSREPAPAPEWGLYLLGSRPRAMPWPDRWVRWPDFLLPLDPADARAAFVEAYERARAGERVEIACQGGRGRTGTALACIAILAGVPPAEATAFVRAGYHRRAVETPWQRRFVRGFARVV
jgi:hypothetical protein